MGPAYKPERRASAGRIYSAPSTFVTEFLQIYGAYSPGGAQERGGTSDGVPPLQFGGAV